MELQIAGWRNDHGSAERASPAAQLPGPFFTGLMNQARHIIRRVTHVTFLAARLLRSIEQCPNTNGPISSKCLAKEFADCTAFGFCDRSYLFRQVRRQRNRELAGSSLHTDTLHSNAK